APAGTKRVSGLHRRPSRASGPVRRRTGGPGRRRISRSGRLLSLVAILLAAALLWFLAELFQPFHGGGGSPVTVTVPPHLSSSQVGDLLARDGVVSSGFFFKLR